MAAKAYYDQAETHAASANELAADARELRKNYLDVSATIARWDEIMSNTHPVVWGIFFIIICVVEFIFSLDLYTDLLPFAPWIIPIGVIVITVFISHALAVKAMVSLRNKEFSDKKHNQAYNSFTDERIWGEIRKNSNRNMMYGILGAVVITGILLFLSFERVKREIGAGMREESFNVYDLLPVIFYVFEIIAGILVLYLFKRIGKGLKARRFRRKLDKVLRQIAYETKLAVQSFEKAEENGFNLMNHTINESVHIAFFRNKNCNPSDEEQYISEPENIASSVKIQLARTEDAKPLDATVHIQTEYNYTGTSKSGKDGLVEINLETFANDKVKKVIAEFADGTDASDEVNFIMANDTPHGLLFRV